MTDVERVTLLHVAYHCEKRGEHSYARVIRGMVQRLAPEARLTERAAEVEAAFGHLQNPNV